MVRESKSIYREGKVMEHLVLKIVGVVAVIIAGWMVYAGYRRLMG